MGHRLAGRGADRRGVRRRARPGAGRLPDAPAGVAAGGCGAGGGAGGDRAGRRFDGDRGDHPAAAVLVGQGQGVDGAVRRADRGAPAPARPARGARPAGRAGHRRRPGRPAGPGAGPAHRHALRRTALRAGRARPRRPDQRRRMGGQLGRLAGRPRAPAGDPARRGHHRKHSKHPGRDRLSAHQAGPQSPGRRAGPDARADRARPVHLGAHRQLGHGDPGPGAVRAAPSGPAGLGRRGDPLAARPGVGPLLLRGGGARPGDHVQPDRPGARGLRPDIPGRDRPAGRAAAAPALGAGGPGGGQRDLGPLPARLRFLGVLGAARGTPAGGELAGTGPAAGARAVPEAGQPALPALPGRPGGGPGGERDHRRAAAPGVDPAHPGRGDAARAGRPGPRHAGRPRGGGGCRGRPAHRVRDHHGHRPGRAARRHRRRGTARRGGQAAAAPHVGRTGLRLRRQPRPRPEPDRTGQPGRNR